MKNRHSFSPRTLGLFALSMIMLVSGGIFYAAADPSIVSEDYLAEVDVNHLQVHLLENGTDVCKQDGKLEMKSLPDAMSPGKNYDEKISVQNGTEVDQYVRVIVRKYWIDEEGKKTTKLDPKLIRLSYGNKDYNTSEWILNSREHTEEADTYYRKNVLSDSESSDLFDTVSIDRSVASESNMVESTRKEGDRTVTTWKFKYEDYQFVIQADVQAVQTHNAKDAVESTWAVDNVTVDSGVINVK